MPTATAEQIAANIAASRLRRYLQNQQREQQRIAAKRKEQADAEPYAEYNGKLIGFVVHTKRGFKPFIGRPINSPGDRDSLVWVVATQDAKETLAEALYCFASDQELVLVLPRPVLNSAMMGHWLNPMLAVQLKPEVT